MTVTYADVADTLPVDVREAIELSLPCAGGFEHLWDEHSSLVETCGVLVPVRTDVWWRCTHCGVATRTDPRPAWAREYRPVSANLEDFL